MNNLRSVLLPILMCATMCVGAQERNHVERASNPIHARSEWNQLVLANHNNVFDVERLFRADTSVRSASHSLEARRARKWIALRMPLADLHGNVGALQPNMEDVVRESRLNTKRSERVLSTDRWRPIGPFGWDTAATMATGSMGIGVVKTHVVDPADSALILAGTISAGMWRSTDAGRTWTNVGLEHPIQSVRRIAMNASMVYAATDAGLYISSDKGRTFRLQPLVGDPSLERAIGVDQVVVSPTNSRRIVVAALGKLFVSTNGGESFSRVSTYEGTWWDLVWHPVRQDVVYGAVQRGGHITFVRSTSSGTKFDSVGLGYPGVSPVRTMARTCIAVSKAAPTMVAVLIAGTIRDSIGGTYGLYVSLDEGSTFEHRCCGSVEGPEPADPIKNINLFDYDPGGNGLGQVTWDMAFAIGDTDTSLMVGAGIFPYVSTDGGRSWKSMPAMHYDIQSASIRNNTIVLTHDGGITISPDRGKTLVDRSIGISAMEIWGYHESHDGSVRALGAYHLPTFIRDTTVYNPGANIDGWYAWSGADAMGANVHPVATEWVYAKPWTSVKTQRTRTKRVAPRATDLGIDLGYLTMSNICFDPHRHYTLVACDHAKNRVVVSYDNANTWHTVRTFDNWLGRVRMSPQSGKHLIVVGDAQVLASADRGASWRTITPPPSMLKGNGVVDMAFHPLDTATIYLAIGGNQDAVKVLRSTDGGATWDDVSAGLPSFAIRTITVRNSQDAEVFVGTSFGVYRSVRGQPFQRYGVGLPISDVNFLSLDEPNGFLRAATLRGVWEIPLEPNTNVRASFSLDTDTVVCSRIPVRFGCRSVAREDPSFSRLWIFEGGEPATSTQRTTDVRYKNPGSYDVTLIVGRGGMFDTMRVENGVTVLPSECDRIDEYTDKAVDLTGPNDNVTLGRLTGDGKEFSFTAWVYPVGMQPSFSAILCTDADAGVEQEIGIQFANEKNEIGYLWKDGRWWWSSGLVVRPNEWSHVALTVDSSGATVYVNGIPRRDEIALPRQNLASLVMKLGTYHNWSSRNFCGYIDEVAFYNRKLSTREIRLGLHLTKRRSDSGLIAYYQFNESRPGRVFEKVAGRDGQLESGASLISSNALVGAGVSDAVLQNTNDAWYPLPLLGDRLRLSQGDGGADLVVTRLNVNPSTAPTGKNVVTNVWWVADSYEVDPRAKVGSFLINSSSLFTPLNAVGKTFHLAMRKGWSTADPWTYAFSGGAGAYVPADQTLLFWLSQDILLPCQFMLGVEGGTVGVAEELFATATIKPNPASDIVTIVNKGQPITIYTALGTVVQHIASDGEETSADVRQLAAGTYIVRAGYITAMLTILR